jgi:hypothetical protein
MTKREKEILSSIIDDIDNSDDKIDPLERLYLSVKEMLAAIP